MMKVNSVKFRNLIGFKNLTTQPKNIQKLNLFWEKELLHKANVCYEMMNDEEIVIHNLHEEAIQNGHFTYLDPKTNQKILTRLRHFLRGKCCGSACRHCVYNHENVIDEYKLKVRQFNSSFWTYPVVNKEPEFDDTCYFNESYLKHRRNKPSPTVTFHFS